MEFIGEYGKESTILLELLTKDEDGVLIPADSTPHAILEYYDANGLSEVTRVTLETIGIGRYISPVIVQSAWKYGDYFITYEAILDGVSYQVRERFVAAEASGSLPIELVVVSDQTILSPTGTPTTLIVSGAPLSGAEIHIIDAQGITKATAITNNKGSWSVEILPGTYTFKFYHIDGNLLRAMEKVVK